LFINILYQIDYFKSILFRFIEKDFCESIKSIA